MKNKLTKHDDKVLANFLRQHRKDATLSLLQTKGFLFCVVCCPERVKPSEWIPLILEDASFKNEAEMKQIMDILMVLYNQINNQILHGTAKLPKECRVLPDTMSNFIDPAPLHQWAQGFMKGYSWLGECWDELFEDSKEAQYNFDMNIMVLGVAADYTAFENAFAGEKDAVERLKMAKDMLAVMPNAVKTFADLALALRDPAPFDPSDEVTMH